MAEEVPKPLVYSAEGQLTSGNESSITYTHRHPSHNLLAVGDTSGHIKMYDYHPGEECQVKKSLCIGSGSSCRILNFSEDGQILCSGSEKGHLFLIDVGTASITCSLKGNKTPPYCVLQLDENTMAIGDDGGSVKVWDIRAAKKMTNEWHLGSDFISDLASGKNRSSLLATCGNGRLYKVDRRGGKWHHSDMNDSELLCVDVVKGGDKVVCGDGEGAVMLYNWGLWEDITDRFPVHAESVDCLLRISDSVICTGCMDGWVRSIQILPNQLLGLVGQHEGGFPVEHMCLSHDSQYLISSSQDSCHFWLLDEIPTLLEPDVSGEEDDEEEVVVKKKKRKRKHKHLAAEKLAKHKKKSSDFFSDL